jgi:hypothetical protein
MFAPQQATSTQMTMMPAMQPVTTTRYVQPSALSFNYVLVPNGTQVMTLDQSSITLRSPTGQTAQITNNSNADTSSVPIIIPIPPGGIPPGDIPPASTTSQFSGRIISSASFPFGNVSGLRLAASSAPKRTPYKRPQ